MSQLTPIVKTSRTPFSVSSKPLFVPTPNQLVNQINEWKAELQAWREEVELLNRLSRMSWSSKKASAYNLLLERLNDLLEKHMANFQTQLADFETNLEIGEFRLIPQGNLDDFEDLQIRMKQLKKEIGNLRLPILEAIACNYPIKIV